MLTPDTIVHLLQQYGYIFMFLVAVAEGPIITIIGAFLAGQGVFNIYLVFVVVSAGDIVGDVIYYYIGKAGRTGALAGVRKWLGMTGEHFNKLEKYVERHGAQILFFAKFTQTGFLILPASGAANMPMWKFLWYNILGTIPKSVALMIFGFYFGYLYNTIDGYFGKASIIFTGVLVALGAAFLIRRYFSKMYE